LAFAAAGVFQGVSDSSFPAPELDGGAGATGEIPGDCDLSISSPAPVDGTIALAIGSGAGAGDGVVSGALGYDGAGSGAALGSRGEAEGVGIAFIPMGLRLVATLGAASAILGAVVRVPVAEGSTVERTSAGGFGVVPEVPAPSGAFGVLAVVWPLEAGAPARSAGDLVSEPHPESKSPTRQAVAQLDERNVAVGRMRLLTPEAGCRTSRPVRNPRTRVGGRLANLARFPQVSFIPRFADL
jgi:hypothetical protein